MKRFFKILKWFFLCLILLILLIYFRPAWTPSIDSANGKKPVATLEKIALGNFKQYVLIRSTDIKNPILLFIHGGPGMPLMYLSHTFQRPLEKRFIVVQSNKEARVSHMIQLFLLKLLMLSNTLRMLFN